MRHRALVTAVLAVVVLAGGCGTVRTRAETLAWARWERCDRFPGVTLIGITAAGEVHAGSSDPDEYARWETCVFRAHRDQAREAAAAHPGPAFPRADEWTGPVCRDGAHAVHTPWDRDVLQTYERLVRAAEAELPRDRGLVVVDELGEAVAAVCGDATRFTVAVSGRALHEMRHSPARHVLLARFVAHELAHVSLSHLTMRGGDVLAMEREADELAAYYLERAGTPCREWVDTIGIAWDIPAWSSRTDERIAIARACELAQRGERPSRRTTAFKERK